MKAWAAALTVVLALPSRGAELPDFGTPADTALSKSRESQIGRGVMLQLRNAGIVMDDPLLTEYVTTIGSQLASRANDGTFQFEFFVAKDDQINAFALPGGFVGINSGLIVASETESELAGVLAHVRGVGPIGAVGNELLPRQAGRECVSGEQVLVMRHRHNVLIDCAACVRYDEDLA